MNVTLAEANKVCDGNKVSEGVAQTYRSQFIIFCYYPLQDHIYVFVISVMNFICGR